MRETTNPPIERTDALTARIAGIIEDLKADDINALDLRGIADFADFFLIATMRSASQMRTISRRIHDTLKLDGVSTVAPIEDESPNWTILDFGDVVVHLFEKKTREHYQLEQVWGDAPEWDWRSR